MAPIYGILSSLKTAACILTAMALFFVASAVLSHHGALVYLAQGPGAIRLFSSPVFLVLYLALLINFAFSARELFRKRATMFSLTHSMSLTQNAAQALEDVSRVLKKDLGFHAANGASGYSCWAVTEKGFPHRHVKRAFTAGVALFIVGAALTILLAFEGTVTLAPGHETAIGEEADPSGLTITSSSPKTAYIEKAKYGKRQGFLSTLHFGLWGPGPLSALETEDLSPIDSRLNLTVKSGGVRATSRTIGVQDPLSYGFYTFSISGFTQTFSVRVDDNPLTLVAGSDEELDIPGLSFPISFSIFREGEIQRLDGSVGTISPHTRIKTPSAIPDESDNDLGKIAPGEATYINGTRLTLVDVVESPVIHYLYNPGSWFLYLGFILIVASSFLRLVLSWRMAAYWIDDSRPIVRLDMHIETKGLFTSKKRLFREFKRLITANDLRPIPIPGERLK